MVAQLDDKEERLQTYDRRLAEAAQADTKAKRMLAVPGIGTITATAIVAAVADAKAFNTGRDLSANLGLIPREHSSGGKQRLYGIIKRGDRYLRTLLIHGAQAGGTRRGQNVAAVALANKLARIAWAGTIGRTTRRPEGE